MMPKKLLSYFKAIPSTVRWAFFTCLILRLFYLGMFGDRMTAYCYEHAFAVQAISLLEGRGLQVHDNYLKKIDEMQFHKLPYLLQPKEYPPYPQDQLGYYHATDMPGYPWILSGLWLFLGTTSFWPVKILQAALSTLIIFPIWEITRRLFDERSAIWSSWLYAFWLPSAYLSQMVCKEAAEGLLMAPACYFLIRYFSNGQKRDLLLAIPCFTLAVFMRSNLVLLPFALCIWGALKFPLKRCGVAFLTCFLFIAICLVPWVLRNKKVVSPEIGVKEGFYWALVWNLAAKDPELFKKVTEYEGMRQNPDGTPRQALRQPPEIDPLAKKVIRENFGLFLKLGMLQGIKGPWQPLEWGYDIFPKESRSFSDFYKATGGNRASYCLKHPLVVLFKLGSRIFEIGVVFLSILAFWVRRDHWRETLMIATCYGLFLFTYMFIHIESRYMVPHTWALLILAGACISPLMESFQRLIFRK